LIKTGFSEKKGIIMIGYQHNEPKLDLMITVKAFELIAKQVRGIQLSKMYTAEFSELIHKEFQRGMLFGWEVLDISP
jgi:hypothetical protein